MSLGTCYVSETELNCNSNIFSDFCFHNDPKDTGIFVYELSVPKSTKPNMILFYQKLQLRAEMLKGSLNTNYKLQLKMVNYGTDMISIEGTTKENFAQFWFHFCNTKQGIYVDQLSLPSHLRRMGVGTYCINWLKEFASDLAFRYIILGSVVEARTFWTKMGFRLLTPDELHNFPGYQGRYNR